MTTVVELEVVVQEERQSEEKLLLVMASLIAMRAWAWACIKAMSSLSELEVGEAPGATTSAGIAEFMMRIRIERRGRVHGRLSIS